MSKLKDRYLSTISKIIFFYSVFYVVMKVLAILQGAWIMPNLILTIPYIIFAIIGGYMFRRNSYNWIYVIAGVILISVIRYFEKEWMMQLHQYFQ